MSQWNFSLCGIPVRMEAAGELPGWAELKPFRVPNTAAAAPSATYRLVWYDTMPSIGGHEVYSGIGYTVRRTPQGWVYLFALNMSGSSPSLLEARPDTGEYVLHCPAACRAEMRLWGAGLSSMLVPDLLLVQNRRLMVHASLVRWHGNGVLFTGPSGMGKSTQANLWETHESAEVLNGDRAVCQIEDDAVTAWGSPWAGSSGIWRNESAPLRAIVSLRQAAENALVPLSGREALAELLPRMATIPWAEERHLQAMDLAIALVNRVPVWRLSCRPDRAAVELVRRTIFNE